MKKLSQFINEWFIFILIGIITIAGLILNNGIDEFKSIDISSFELNRLAGLLGSIFFVALLVERFLEIFVTDARYKEKKELTLKIEELEKKKPSEKEAEVKTEIMQLRLELEMFKKERERVITIAGFLVGTIVALFGVRILSNLISTQGMGILQEKYINIMDMILTGGLIAGGSGGIHALLNMIQKAIFSKPEN